MMRCNKDELIYDLAMAYTRSYIKEIELEHRADIDEYTPEAIKKDIGQISEVFKQAVNELENNFAGVYEW